MTRAARLILLAAWTSLACFHRHEVARGQWGALAGDNSITVRTLDGTTRKFNRYMFSTAGLSAWRQVDSLMRADSTLIPLDSIAVVRVTRFNPGATAMLVAAASTAAFVIIAQTKSDVRPEPVPRPSSCPFLYSFDGESYVFDSETYAGAIARGLERADVDNLDHLRPVKGRYRLRFSNERDETDYTDALSLLVADHPAETRALPDASGVVHVVGAGTAPARLREIPGDTIPSRSSWELSFARPGSATRHDTVAVVLRVRNTPLAPFVLQHTLGLLGSDVYAWYATMKSQLMARAVVQAWIQREGYLDVQVPSAGGAGWSTVARLPDVGPAIAKTQVVLIDTRAMSGDTVTVRLEASPGLWSLESAELAGYLGRATVQTLRLARAVDNRGADVTPLLAERDGRYLVALRGDTVYAEYDVPPPASDARRSVLAVTTGHYYLSTDDQASPRRDVVDRLMRDRAFMQRYFADAWVRSGGAPLLKTGTP